jgi:pectate lyase
MISHFRFMSSALCLGVILSAAELLFGAPAANERMFPAFPGAEGAGAYTRGGRGGRVLRVTTLADYNPKGQSPIEGSLRAALVAKGPRTVVFAVGGNIELKTDLTIAEPFITVAGQTASGFGICLKGASLKIAAPQVIVRYLRVRPGDLGQRELDCISCRAQDVIIDHCSASWGIDETISTNGNSGNVTVSWCMIVESLNRSVHHKGSHGYGSLISGPAPISYHHNIYAYHRSRNPRGGDVLLDFRSNVVVGWGDRAGYSGDDRLEMNYVGNYLRSASYSKLKQTAFSPGGLRQKYYLAGNVFDGFAEGTEDNWLLVQPPSGQNYDTTRRALEVPGPFPSNTVTTQSGAESYDLVLAAAGATLPARDPVDQRIIEQIRNRRDRLIDSQTEVGGWPALAAGAAPEDRDGDGLPDDWEREVGFDPAKIDASEQDTDGDGYTDVEEWLNDTNPRATDRWIDPPRFETACEGAFLEPITIKMSAATEDGEICYTLDGTEPTASSPKYKMPIELADSATLRAKTFEAAVGSHVRNARFTHLKLAPPVAAKGVRPGVAYRYVEDAPEPTLAALEAAPAAASGIAPTVSLAPRKRDEKFGFVFEGYFTAPADGIYTFTLRSSPRCVLAIAGQDVVETQGRRRERDGVVALRRGLHPFRFLIYFPNGADKELEIDFAGPGLARQPLSGQWLSCSAP